MGLSGLQGCVNRHLVRPVENPPWRELVEGHPIPGTTMLKINLRTPSPGGRRCAEAGEGWGEGEEYVPREYQGANTYPCPEPETTMTARG